MNKIFLPGEKIDLCIPEEDDFGQWAGWFNSQKTTRFLEQGKLPNTEKQQKEFYEKAVSSGRLICLIKTKKGVLLGVISLSDIDYEKNSCQIALVCPEKSKEAALAPLEAMAIITQHAFDRLNMERVWAGQAYPGLKDWSQKLELLGYYSEGILFGAFQHGSTRTDSIRIACIRGRYAALAQRRGGVLWAGELRMKGMIAAMKKTRPMAEQLHDALQSLYEKRSTVVQAAESDVGQ